MKIQNRGNGSFLGPKSTLFFYFCSLDFSEIVPDDKLKKCANEKNPYWAQIVGNWSFWGTNSTLFDFSLNLFSRFL